MKLVNETGQKVFYTISGGGASDCGTIDVNGDVDFPGYDNTPDVQIAFSADSDDDVFEVTCGNTATNQTVRMAVVVE